MIPQNATPPSSLYRKILVPLDGSALAEVALRHAGSLAWAYGAEVTLLRVIQISWPLNAPDAGIEGNLALDRAREEARTYLKALCGELREQKIVAHAVVLSGPAAETIVDYARQEGVDLIVMSNRGRSGLSRWVFGSVAERVLQGAPCPVLLVRAGDN